MLLYVVVHLSFRYNQVFYLATQTRVTVNSESYLQRIKQCFKTKPYYKPFTLAILYYIFFAWKWWNQYYINYLVRINKIIVLRTPNLHISSVNRYMYHFLTIRFYRKLVRITRIIESNAEISKVSAFKCLAKNGMSSVTFNPLNAVLS